MPCDCQVLWVILERYFSMECQLECKQAMQSLIIFCMKLTSFFRNRLTISEDRRKIKELIRRNKYALQRLRRKTYFGICRK